MSQKDPKSYTDNESGTQHAARHNLDGDAMLTMHSGSSRPSYALAGTMWLDTTGTPWLLKVYDGSTDIKLGEVNASTNVFIPTVDTIKELNAGAGIDIDGMVFKDGGPKPTSWPSFHATLSTDQLNITDTDQIEFDTITGGEAFDTNSNFNVGTFKFLPTVAGKYLLITKVHWLNVIVGDIIALYIKKNGSFVATSLETAQRTEPYQSLSTILNANGSTDYFEVFAQNGMRNTSDIDSPENETFFTGSRIA